MWEDDYRIRQEQAGELISAIRHMTFNPMNSDTISNAGIKHEGVEIPITCLKSYQGWGFRNLSLITSPLITRMPPKFWLSSKTWRQICYALKPRKGQYQAETKIGEYEHCLPREVIIAGFASLGEE